MIKTAKLNEVLLIVDVDSVEIKEGESQGEGWRRAKGISIGITQISSVKRDEAAIRGQRVKGPHLEVEANMRRSWCLQVQVFPLKGRLNFLSLKTFV